MKQTLLMLVVKKFYPAEVEEVILALPNIEDVAVFGERNAMLGHIVVAKVKLKTNEPLKDLKNENKKRV